MTTKIPGSCVVHKTVTDVCRQNKTDEGCVNEVIVEITKQLCQLLTRSQLGHGWQMHVVLTCERPQPHGGIGNDDG